MAFFDGLVNKATELAQTGAAKSKQVAELAKLNLNNASEEDAIKKAYQEIGKIYYEANGTNPDPAFAIACEKVTTAKINIEENRSRIAELKANDAIYEAPVEAEEPVCDCDVPQAPEEPEAPAEPEEPKE